MVAVIAGNGLGLDASSLGQLGLTAGSQSTVGQKEIDQYLNVVNGNLVLQSADEGLVFDGLRLSMLRTYNSQGLLAGSNGWTYGFTRSIGGLAGILNSIGSSVERTADDGSVVTYTYDADRGLYVSTDQAGPRDTLAWDASQQTWTWSDPANDQEEIYGALGQLLSWTDTVRSATYTFSYTDGRLSHIEAGDGDALELAYDQDGRLSELSIVEVQAGSTDTMVRQEVAYTYDDRGRLESVATTLASDSVSSSSTYITRYAYDGDSDRLASVNQSDATFVFYEYVEVEPGDFRVASITTGEGRYAQVVQFTYGDGVTQVTNGAGETWSYTFDASARLTSVIAPEVNGVQPTSSYTYDSDGNLLSVTDANGNATHYAYNEDGNLLTAEDATGHVVHYTYDDADHILSKTTYAIAATDTQEAKAPQTTYYVYDSSEHLRFVVDPMGNVTENTYSRGVSGESLLSSSRIYLGARYDLGSSSLLDPPSIGAMEAWASQSAVKATLANSNLVDFAYDLRGQLSRRTQWATLDANGVGIANDAAVVTRMTYDARGQLLQSTTGSDATSTFSYAYDGLGRLVSMVDATGASTSYMYYDNDFRVNYRLSVTQPDGTKILEIRNSAGQIISSTITPASESAIKRAVYFYNDVGREIATITLGATQAYDNPTNTRMFTFYDADGRVSGTVDGAGAVTEYVRDASGNITSVKRYALKVSVDDWLNGSGPTAQLPAALPLPTASAGDTVSLTIYDAAGRAVGSVDPYGAVTTRVYDGNGQLVSSTLYAVPLSPAQRAGLGDAPTLQALMSVIQATPGKDEITRSIFDANGRQVASIDPAGVVTVVIYDAAGDVLASKTYATPLSTGQLDGFGTATTMQQLQDALASTIQIIYDAEGRPVANVASPGSVAYTFYDSNGRVTDEVDVSGHVVRYVYDAADHIVTTVSYATTIDTTAWVDNGQLTATYPAVLPLPATSESDTYVRSIYDTEGHVVATVDAGGTVVLDHFDASGNLTARTHYATALSASQQALLGDDPTIGQLQATVVASQNDLTERHVYDALSREIASIGANGSVTTTTFAPDGSSVIVHTYAHVLTQQQMDALGDEPLLGDLMPDLLETSSDSISISLYGNTGQLIGTVDPDGVVVENSYSDTGDRIATVTYATALTAAQITQLEATPTPATLDALVASTQADQVSHFIHDGAHHLVAEIDPQGGVTQFFYNLAGDVVAKVVSTVMLTQAQRDGLGPEPSLGELQGMLDLISGAIAQISIFDAMGNVVATIDPSGYVATASYDAEGHIVNTIRFAEALTLEQRLQLGAVPTDEALLSMVSGMPVSEMQILDAQGNIVDKVDENGAVTSYSYDTDGRELSRIVYAVPLTQSQISQLGAAATQGGLESLLDSGEQDQITLTIYDAEGHLQARIDPQQYYSPSYVWVWGGDVTIYTVDANGDTTAETNYYLQLSHQQLLTLGTSPTLADLQSVVAPTANDYTSRTVYDAAHRVTATVSSNGYVVVNRYDGEGNLTSSISYDNSLDTYQRQSLGLSPTLSEVLDQVTPSDYDEITRNLFDGSGRLVAAVSPAYDSYNGGYGGNVTLIDYQPWGSLSRGYEIALTHSQLDALGDDLTVSDIQALLTASDDDILSFAFTDGGTEASVDSDGAISIWTTKSTGEARTTFANSLTQAQLLELASAPSFNHLLQEVVAGEGDEYEIWLHDDASKTKVHVEPSGAVTLKVSDSSGDTVSIVKYAAHLTSSQMAALAADPSIALLQTMLAGNTVRQFDISPFYDENGNMLASVNESGQVTTFVYDGAGNFISSTRYGSKLSYAQLQQLAQAPSYGVLETMISSGPSDSAAVAIYDPQGNRVAYVDYDGSLTSYIFDENNNLVAELTHTVRLSPAQIAELLKAPNPAALQIELSAAQQQRVEQTLYDSQGNLVAKVDEQGVVSIFVYDAAGHLIKTTVFSNAIDAQAGYFASMTDLLDTVSPSAADIVTRTVYDQSGRPVASIDTDGIVTITTYDANGSVSEVTTYSIPLNRTQIAALGSNPSLEQIEALVGPTTRAIYDASGRQIVVIDALGQASYRFYDSQGLLVETIDPLGRVVALEYDPNGRVTRTTEFATLLDTTAWLLEGQLTSSYSVVAQPPSASPQDRVTSAVYDIEGRIVAGVDPAGRVTTTVYDAYGNAVSQTAFAEALTEAQRSDFETNPSLSLLQSLLTASTNDRTTRNMFDADDRLVLSIDGDGYVTSTDYDAVGNAVRQTRYSQALSDAQRSSLASDSTADDVLSLVSLSALDETTLYYHDSMHRLVAQIDSEGYLTSTSYASTGVVVQTRYQDAITAPQLATLTGQETVAMLVGLIPDGGSAEQSQTAYDTAGRVAWELAPDGTLTTYTYDNDGRLLSSEVAAAQGQGGVRTTESAYDALGNVVTSEDAVGAQTLYDYDALGRMTRSTDPLGNSTWYYYDAGGELLFRVVGQSDASGTRNSFGDVTEYRYDSFGDLVTTISYTGRVSLAAGMDTSAGILDADAAKPADVAAAVSTLENPSGHANGVFTRTYNKDGELVSITDGNGYETRYRYDAFGELSSIQQQTSAPGTALDASNSQTTRYTYDHRGDRIAEIGAYGTSEAASLLRSYDASGRLIRETDPSGSVTTYAYDRLGRQISSTRVVQGTARTQSASYDAYGRLLSRTDALGNVTQYQYDIETHTVTVTSPGGLTSITVANAFGNTLSITDGAGNVTSFTYDEDGRLRTTTDALGNTSSNVYDLNGELTSTVDPSGLVTEYSYDASGRVQVSVVDPSGLHRITQYTYDGQGRVISVVDADDIKTISTYDSAGNLIEQVRVGGADETLSLATSYIYDGVGNILSMTTGDGSLSSTTSYTYDAMNRLVTSTIDPDGLNQTTRYAYDADGRVVSVTDPNGNTTYTVYNQAGEAVYTITPVGDQASSMGSVTRRWFDADGHMVATCVYTNAVDTTALEALANGAADANLQLGAGLVANAAGGRDSSSYAVYDTDGNLRYGIDANGTVTETRYDSAGRAAETIVYDQKLAISQTLAQTIWSGTDTEAAMTNALLAAGASEANARVGYTFYDADGRVQFTGTRDTYGGVLRIAFTERLYDASGRLGREIAYGVPLDASVIGIDLLAGDALEGALNAVNPSTSRSETSYYYNIAGQLIATTTPGGGLYYTSYDQAGRVDFTIDAAGHMVSYSYDALGRVIEQVGYADALDIDLWPIITGGSPASSVQIPEADPSADHIVLFTYDDIGRVATKTSYNRTERVDFYDDNLGQYVQGTVYTGDRVVYTYDKASRLVQIDDIGFYNGHASSDWTPASIDIRLDTSKPMVFVQASTTRTTRYFYDENGNQVGKLDADGYLVADTYDASGHAVRKTAYATPVLSELRASGSLADLVPPASGDDKIVRNFYDAQGRLVGTLDAAGYFTQFTYDRNGRQLSSLRFATAVDDSQIASLEDIETLLAGGASHQTIYQYDAFGDLTSARDYQDTLTTYEYDDRGHVVRTVVAANSLDERVTSATFDAFGNQLSSTDGEGNTTTFTYDGDGHLTSRTDALGNTTWFMYDSAGRMIRQVVGIVVDGVANAQGERIDYLYDSFGNLLQTEAFAARVSVSDACELIDDTDGGDDNADIYYKYDTSGHLIGTYTDDDDFRRTYAYDGFGELIYSKDGGDFSRSAKSTFYSYDARGDLISEIDFNSYGSSAQRAFSSSEISSNDILRERDWSYDAFGRSVSYTDGNGNTTTYAYDKLDGQIQQSLIVQGSPRVSTTSYDAYGRVLSKIDSLGLVTQYTYDDTHRSMTVISPGGLITVSEKNREGQTIATIEPSGATTRYTYDRDGMLLSTERPDGSVSHNEYDAGGNLVEATDPSGCVITYTYDAAGRVLSQTVDPAGLHLVTTHTYNGRGLEITTVDPDGAVTIYTHDSHGNVIEKIIDPDELNIVTDYYINEFDEIAEEHSYGNFPTSYSVNEYDALGRLISSFSGTGGYATTYYSYDANGNITRKAVGSKDDPFVASYYFYNEAGEQVLAFSTVGGENSSGYYSGYDSPPQLAITQHWYNADGLLVATRQYSDVVSNEYRYDIDLLSRSKLDTESILATAATFVHPCAADPVVYRVYDAAGRLRYTIDQAGFVTDRRYNPAGQVSGTLTYPYAISVDSGLSGAMLAGTVSDADIRQALINAGDNDTNARGTLVYYDIDGQVAYSISLATIDDQEGGIVTAYTYDADGRKTSETVYGALLSMDRLGNASTTQTIALDLEDVTEFRTVRYVYDQAGRQVYAVDASGGVTETQYDGNGRVTWVLQYVNPIALSASAGLDEIAVALQAANSGATDVRGVGNAYDAAGNIHQTLDMTSAVPTATYTYDARGLKTSYTNKEGQTWTYEYNSAGNLSKETSPEATFGSYSDDGSYSTSTLALISNYEYGVTGRLIRKFLTAPDGERWQISYFYDATSNLVRTETRQLATIDPQTGILVRGDSEATVTTSDSYNSLNQLVVSKDANGNYSYKAYDRDGRLAYEVDADGYVTAHSYNGFGEETGVVRYASAVDPSTLSDWSDGDELSFGQIHDLVVVSAGDRSISITYDAAGRKTSVSQSAMSYVASDGSAAVGSPTTRYTYDVYGELTSTAVLVEGDPDLGTAVWATSYTYYNDAGRRSVTVDPEGYVSSWNYDGTGKVTESIEWATPIDTSSLVAGGAAPALPLPGDPGTTGEDRVTRYTYDAVGNKATESVSRTYIDANGDTVHGFVTTAYGYDGEGRVTSVSQNGQTVTTQYDALGRIASVTGPQQRVLVANWQQLLDNDPTLNLDSDALYTSAAQVVSYTYDTFGNKVSQTQGNTATAQSSTSYYRYDNGGHLLASLAPLDGHTVDWTSGQAIFMAYDANGNLLQTVSTLDGNDGTSAKVYVRNAYDASGQLLSTTTQRSGAALPDKVVSSTYNAFGEIVASGNGIVDKNFATYDADGRLVSATDPSTGVVHTYGYNLAGQLMTDSTPLGGGVAQVRYTVDLDGRVIAEQGPSTNAATGANSGSLTATYDRWGNVLASTDAAGNTTTYSYNELNLMVAQAGPAVSVVGIDGVAITVTPIKTTAYNAEGNIVARTDENGNATIITVNGLGQATRIVDGAGAVSYISYDALGNEVAEQNGIGHITFRSLDALGRVVAQGDFVASSDGTQRSAVWRQAYVLDQAGNRLVSYDGIGSAYLQDGDTANAALHANYYGYDSQGRVIWSQDAAQHAASNGSHGTQQWSPVTPNGGFESGDVDWNKGDGWTIQSAAGGYNSGWSAQLDNVGAAGSKSPGSTISSQNLVPVLEGQVIHASAMIQQGASDVDHTGGAVRILWYSAEGVLIGSSTGNYINEGSHGAWHQSTLTATAPPGAAFAALAVNGWNISSDPLWADDITWDYVPDPAATQTLDIPLIVSLPTGIFTQQPANADFQKGDVGWTAGDGWSILEGYDYNGTGWAARIDNFGDAGTTSPGSTLVNDNRVPVSPGQVISASAQVQQGASDVGHTGAAVQILWYDADGNLIGTSTGNYVTDGRHGAWHASSVTGTAPAGAVYAGIAINGWNISQDPLYVDSVRWNYQYLPSIPTGIIQNTYNYDVDGNLVRQVNADGDSESWTYDTHGRVLAHTDLSGAQYSYTYDTDTGLLIGASDNWSAASQGQVASPYITGPIDTPNSSTRTYYADGQLATLTYADGSSYSYSYDANGNLVREESTTHDGGNQLVHTLTVTSYDSHNRISHVVQTDVTTNTVTLEESYSYDAAGNRREVSATSNGTTVDAWYTYDGDNRVVVSAGTLTDGVILVNSGADSYALAYDGAGNVVSRRTLSSAGHTLLQQSHYNLRGEMVQADYAIDVTAGGAYRGIEEKRSYDAAGHVIVTQQYYALGTTLQARPHTKVDPDDPDAYGGGTVDVGGQLSSATVDHYDSVGRLFEEQNFGHASGWDGTGGDIALPTEPPALDATSYGSLALQNEVVYQGVNLTPGYDAMGNVVAYQYREAGGRTDQYQVTYYKKDGYLQAVTSGQNVSNTPNVQPATDESIYDTRGNLVALAQHTQYAGGSNVADMVRLFAYNGSGEIIERRDGTVVNGVFGQGTDASHATQHYVYVNGQQLAHYDDGGTVDVLAEVTAFSSSDSGATGYVVQAGDTLESIAQAVYGNVSLWYVIAQANALAGNEELAIGQRLTIPAVTTNQNDATTFKPYDPGSIVGSTTPNLPSIAPPPPPTNAHCNVVAQIIVVAVVVVVSYFTAGALSGMATTWAGSVLAGAAAGAAGSAAGQLAGDALGVHQGFSFSELAMGAAGGAIAGGVGYGLGHSTTFTNNVNGLNASGEAVTVAGGPLNAAGFAVEGAAGYVGNYEAGKALNQPEHFSWAGLVAASTGAVVGGQLGSAKVETQAGKYGSGSYGQTLVARAAEDVVTREVSMGLGDRHVQSWTQIGVDVAGNAIGQPIGEMALAAYRQQQASQTSSSLAYDPNNPLSRNNAAGYRGLDSRTPISIGVGSSGDDRWTQDAAWERQAEAILASSPQMAATDAYATYTAWMGLGQSPEPTGAPRMMRTDLPTQIDGKPVTNLPTVVVTPDERFDQDYANLWQWAVLNRQTPPPVTTSQTELNTYRQQAYEVTAPAYQDWLNRSFPAHHTPAPQGYPDIGKDIENLLVQPVDAWAASVQSTSHEARLNARDWATDPGNSPWEAAGKSIDYAFVALGDTLMQAGAGAVRFFTDPGVREGVAHAIDHPGATATQVLQHVRSMDSEDWGTAGFGVLVGGSGVLGDLNAAAREGQFATALPKVSDNALWRDYRSPNGVDSGPMSIVGLDGSIGQSTSTIGVNRSQVADRVAFKSGGDRLIGSMGSARGSVELKAIESNLRANGVDIRYSNNEFAYGPASMPGRPGNIVFDPDASISSIRHEYGHFVDDKVLGFPGQRFYYENPQFRVATERSQYLGETRTARQLGDTDARRMLIQDYLNERQYLIDNYYFTPDGTKIPYGGPFGR